ncbi:MAG: redoxin domain-containing protein [Cyanobacteria bacterium RI_101]|nr:redoxin domain-containing protein [Cyanobacteria bacterium RI_101]
MRQPSQLIWLSLCLAGLAGASAFMTMTPGQATAQPAPVVAQANPGAAKKANVGGPLAKQLQGKPVVVDIYASWCSACKNIAPTLSQLKQEYGNKAHFVVLDVSDKAKAGKAASEAQKLGLGQFFAANKTQTGMVAIIDPATGAILAQYRNNPNKADYSSVLNTALGKK